MIARPVTWPLRQSGLLTGRIGEESIHIGFANFRGTLQANAYAGLNRLYDTGCIQEAA